MGHDAAQRAARHRGGALTPRRAAARAESADAFAAIADATRRDILALLREGERTAGAIAGAFPAISRPAVSRHLRVLREAGLVRARQDGRAWRYNIDARAIGALYREWFEQFAPLWDQALRNLKARAES